jgi:hypothetical protein
MRWWLFPSQPQQKNQIPFWVNYNLCVARLKIKVTHLFLSLSKQLTQADSMLQCLFISTIIFKDPDLKLGHIATTNSTLTQVTLILMDGAWKTTRPVSNFPPCLSLHIHSKYMRVINLLVPNIAQATVKKHICWFWRCHLSLISPFRFLKDSCCSFRWVDVHTHALTILLHIFNHMEVRGGCRIEPQLSLTNRMDATQQYLQLLGYRIADDIAVSISPKAPA